MRVPNISHKEPSVVSDTRKSIDALDNSVKELAQKELADQLKEAIDGSVPKTKAETAEDKREQGPLKRLRKVFGDIVKSPVKHAIPHQDPLEKDLAESGFQPEQIDQFVKNAANVLNSSKSE